MSWRFRRSFKVIPGVRLNLSKSGLSCSIGGAPLTLNIGPRGVYGTGSLPGTGISFRQQFSGIAYPQDPTSPNPVSPHPSPSPVSFSIPNTSAPAVEEIRSGSTELMTSEGLKELKQLIQTTYQEHSEIVNNLDLARQEKVTTNDRYLSWDSGFLLKRIFKTAFAKRQSESETADAKVEELEEQLRLTTVATQIEIAKAQADSYFRMRDDFAALCQCAAIWDIKSQQATDRVRERTTASR